MATAFDNSSMRTLCGLQPVLKLGEASSQEEGAAVLLILVDELDSLLSQHIWMRVKGRDRVGGVPGK